jgi:hypothetical protein
VKRLVLLNFFRAEAEKTRNERNHPTVIYAIEEPETSQHIYHQKLLIDSLNKLSTKSNVQIILTTHSSFMVKQLKYSDLRLINDDGNGRTVTNVVPGVLPYPSLNEVNFSAFGDYSIEYHNELYGYLQSIAIDDNPSNEREKNFENWLVGKGCEQTKSWVREKNGIAQPSQLETLHTYVRNAIHHPENKNNPKYTSQELKDSIEGMRSLIKSLKEE